MNNLHQSAAAEWRAVRFNPLRSLTPARLASALDQWDAGWLREAALIFETIERREAIIRSVMSKRRASVSRRPWQIIIPDPDDPRAEDHKNTLQFFYSNLIVSADRAVIDPASPSAGSQDLHP